MGTSLKFISEKVPRESVVFARKKSAPSGSWGHGPKRMLILKEVLTPNDRHPALSAQDGAPGWA